LEGLELEGGICGIQDKTFFGQVVLCNNRIIKISEMPLNCEEFMYYMLVWEPRYGSWAGIGIPELIETPQRGLKVAVRAGSDNLAWSVGPQLLYRDGLIEPVDGEGWTPHAYKRWKVLVDGLQALTGKELDPKLAMQFLEFPNYLGHILPWIEFWLRMAEATTGLSLLLQGQKTSDSVGVTQALQNNSTTNLRLLVRQWDDDVCSPIIQHMYEWVQQYGPETARGDAVARPLGSSTLIARELQQQAVVQFLDRSVQPVFGISPKKMAKAFFEGLQISADSLALEEEERQQLEAASQQPDARVEVERLRGETQLKITDMSARLEHMKILLNAQLKALSLDHADTVVRAQMETTLQAETLKQVGGERREHVKAGLKPEGEDSDREINGALATLGL